MLEEWFLAFTASPWVFLALYVCATVDGFFPPIPSESVVIALAAVGMATGVPNLWLVIAVAAAGAFTGDQIAYALGRRAHLRTSRLLRGPRAQRAVTWAERALSTRGASFIIGARYIPVGRVAVNMTAGAVGFPRGRFVGLTAVAAVSWAFYSTAIGIGAGAWLHDRPVVAVVVGVVAGTLIGLGVDAVLSRVHGRPRATRGARSAPATEPEPPGAGAQDRGTHQQGTPVALMEPAMSSPAMSTHGMSTHGMSAHSMSTPAALSGPAAVSGPSMVLPGRDVS